MNELIQKARKASVSANIFAMTALDRAKNAVLTRTKKLFAENKAEGFVDTAVKILMAVVIGALVLAGLYMLFKDTILPELTKRIKDMFNYRG